MTPPISLLKTRTAVDTYLKLLFAERKASAGQVDPSYSALWEAIEQVAMAGGKRLRPYLVVVGYGGLDEKIVDVAAAWECLHIALLMHDDVIDQDFVRHGHHNVSGLYRDTYARSTDGQRAAHYANSAAILAGDLLLAEAYRLVHAASFEDSIRRQAMQELHTALFEVMGGELIDVEASFVRDTTIDPLAIYRYKTAGYSFIGPLLTGAYCAGLELSIIETLRDFALHAGIAFQIQDDVHNVYSETSEIGKPVLSDLREGKRTLLSVYHVEHMDTQQARHFAAFGDPSSNDETLKVIQHDMEASGARAYAEQCANKHTRAATGCLEALPDGSRKNTLRELLQRLSHRTH